MNKGTGCAEVQGVTLLITVQRKEPTQDSPDLLDNVAMARSKKVNTTRYLPGLASQKISTLVQDTKVFTFVSTSPSSSVSPFVSVSLFGLLPPPLLLVLSFPNLS